MQAMEQLVDKHSSQLEYTRNENAFSFRINIISFLKNSKKTIGSVTNIYHNELMSATEIMNVSSDDIQDYVNELIDSLQEYRSLCSDDDTYNDSLRLTLINLFDQYTRLFKKVPEFDKVTIALQSVAILIKDNKVKNIIKAKNTEMARHIEELNTTIEAWIKDVIINQDSIDVHYSDHNIMSNCRLIEEDFS